MALSLHQKSGYYYAKYDVFFFRVFINLNEENRVPIKNQATVNTVVGFSVVQKIHI